jgi:hypothetical protein
MKVTVVLVQHHAVGRLQQRVIAQVDLGLAAAGHFVVLALDLQTAALHG